MKYLCLLFITIFTIPAFSQSKKLYLNANNQLTTNKDSASIYLVIGQMDKDSLYSMSQYTIRDSILMSGTFKDSTLTIPQGKFTYYYTPAEIQTWKKSHIIGGDTNKYIKNTGTYTYGKKNGLWNTYDYNGDLQNSTTYKNDVPSGPYKFIDNGPTGITAHVYQGTNVDGKKEGEAKVISLYGRLEETRYFHDDQLAKTSVNHKVDKGIIQPTPPLNFKAYINKKMAGYAKPDNGQLIIRFIIGKDGLAKDFNIFSGCDDEAKNQALIDMLKNSSVWKAGTIDGHKADMVTFCTISYTKAGFSYLVPRY